MIRDAQILNENRNKNYYKLLLMAKENSKLKQNIQELESRQKQNRIDQQNNQHQIQLKEVEQQTIIEQNIEQIKSLKQQLRIQQDNFNNKEKEIIELKNTLQQLQSGQLQQNKIRQQAQAQQSNPLQQSVDQTVQLQGNLDQKMKECEKQKLVLEQLINQLRQLTEKVMNYQNRKLSNLQQFDFPIKNLFNLQREIRISEKKYEQLVLLIGLPNSGKTSFLKCLSFFIQKAHVEQPIKQIEIDKLNQSILQNYFFGEEKVCYSRIRLNPQTVSSFQFFSGEELKMVENRIMEALVTRFYFNSANTVLFFITSPDIALIQHIQLEFPQKQIVFLHNYTDVANKETANAMLKNFAIETKLMQKLEKFMINNQEIPFVSYFQPNTNFYHVLFYYNHDLLQEKEGYQKFMDNNIPSIACIANLINKTITTQENSLGQKFMKFLHGNDNVKHYFDNEDLSEKLNMKFEKNQFTAQFKNPQDEYTIPYSDFINSNKFLTATGNSLVTKDEPNRIELSIPYLSQILNIQVQKTSDKTILWCRGTVLNEFGYCQEIRNNILDVEEFKQVENTNTVQIICPEN